MSNSHSPRSVEHARGFAFAAYTSCAAFSVYFCMYAFRKPFAAAEYEGLELGGMDYKILLILSQVAGYTVSKFIGIKLIAEMPSQRRIPFLVGLILFAEASLIGLGLVPFPYNFPFMFLNGLPLGMVWGLVFSFVEGRQSTEALAAVLSASFIVSSGIVKAVGRFTVDFWGVPEFWMPAVTGLLFMAPFFFFTWMLRRVPPPSREDEARRTPRVPMDRGQRRQFVKLMFWSLVTLVITHMLLTALRDYRDQFAVEILGAVDADGAAYLATSELPISVFILIPLGATMLVRRHRAAITLLHGMLLFGFVLATASTWAFQMGWLGGFVWYILVGTGLYLAYVPFHSMLFERVIALFRHPGNAAFLIYIADATGYLSSVAILLYKNFGAQQMSPLRFFISTTYVSSVIGIVLVLFSLAYLLYRKQHDASANPGVDIRRSDRAALS